ncbi:putative uncharacterized protein FLJ13197 isoform X4 [Nomascus leucogenys]|uniref:putative uncharacterized protein FLJ13197 isoform X4 n=1 Tax=Nomascus leucogenys TaxID=61853 RepID=UPI00122DA0FB|nr:putative uncharacterized protein FLJ13197 isoform X4 [Nomascus leucogenys]
MSGLQSGRRWRPQGTGTGARAAGALAALRLGPRLRAAPLLAPLWLLAPTPGSHMTPAPLALRASRGWRALEENTLNSSSWLTFGEREETRMKEPVEGLYFSTWTTLRANCSYWSGSNE